MSNLKAINQQLAKVRNIKELAALDFVQERTIKNYEMIWGRKDGENWFQAEVAHMLVAFAEKPELAQCDKMSIWGCLQTAAREGLSLHQGHLDLVKYGNILKADRNYKGMRHQLRSMPKIKFVGEARLVWKEDEFEFDERSMLVTVHKRKGAPKSMQLDNLVAAYVTIEFADGKNVDVVMWQQEVIAAKNKTKNKSEAGPWAQHPWEMAKKTVIKRANKIYFERPQVEVVGFTAAPKEEEEEEETQDTTHQEVVDQDTGEVTQHQEAEVVQEQQAPPPVEVPKKKSGMDDFLNS